MQDSTLAFITGLYLFFFFSLCIILKYIVLDCVQLVYFSVHNLSCGPGTLEYVYEDQSIIPPTY
jgi:hypothetical protein